MQSPCLFPAILLVQKTAARLAWPGDREVLILSQIKPTILQTLE